MKLYQYLILLLVVPYALIAMEKDLSIHPYEGQEEFLDSFSTAQITPTHKTVNALLGCAKINGRIAGRFGLISEIYKTKILKENKKKVGFVAYTFRTAACCGIHLGANGCIVGIGVNRDDQYDTYKQKLLNFAVTDAYCHGFVKSIFVFINKNDGAAQKFFTDNNFKKESLVQSGEDEKYVLNLVNKKES